MSEGCLKPCWTNKFEKPLNFLRVKKFCYTKRGLFFKDTSLKLFKKLFKNDEKYFSFHLRSSLRPWDIKIFGATFWLWRKRLDKNQNFGEVGNRIAFLAWFLTKILLRLYFTYCLNFIVWLPLLLEISGNIFVVILCYPVCYTINFEYYLNF